MKPDVAFTALADAIKEHGAPICQEIDGELWFPENGGGGGYEVRLARKLCSSCPVQRECLQFALANNEMYGIWGGLSVTERLRLKRPNYRPKTRANAPKTAK
jgi:WhiB family redox-sensing transcriptional regulator